MAAELTEERVAVTVAGWTMVVVVICSEPAEEPEGRDADTASAEDMTMPGVVVMVVVRVRVVRGIVTVVTSLWRGC